MTTGPSLAVVRHDIESGGGRVAPATTLNHAPARWAGVQATLLAIAPGTAAESRREFGRRAVDAMLQHHGIASSIQALTESQGRLLLEGELSLDAIRDRIVAARQAAGTGGSQGQVPPSEAQGEVAHSRSLPPGGEPIFPEDDGGRKPRRDIPQIQSAAIKTASIVIKGLHEGSVTPDTAGVRPLRDDGDDSLSDFVSGKRHRPGHKFVAGT